MANYLDEIELQYNLTIDFSVKISLLDIKIQGCVNYINYEEKFRAKTSFKIHVSIECECIFFSTPP